MERAEQISIGHGLLAHIDVKSTGRADSVYRLGVADHACRDRLAPEGQAFFRRMPLAIGLSCLLPEPGDFLAHDHSGDPMLFGRRRDGDPRAFPNVCRHRGAGFVQGWGAASALARPCHARSGGLERTRARPFHSRARDTLGLEAA